MSELHCTVVVWMQVFSSVIVKKATNRHNRTFYVTLHPCICCYKNERCPLPRKLSNVNESDPRSDVHYLGSSENKA